MNLILRIPTKWYVLAMAAGIATIVLIENFWEDVNCTNMVENVKKISRQNAGDRGAIVELTNIQQLQNIQPRQVALPGQIVFGCTATAYIANGTKQSIRYFRSKNGSDFYTGIEVND